LELNKLRNIRRLDGVKDVGALGFGTGSMIFNNESLEPLDISIIGVEINKPGSPSVISGNELRQRQRDEALVDNKVARKYFLELGDFITVKTIQGTEEKEYSLRIVGFTDSREYLYQPSIFVPLQIWEKIRPQPNPDPNRVVTVSNVAAVQIENNADPNMVSSLIASQIAEVEVADIETSVKAIPGYTAQQSTLGLTNGFTFLIGILVIAGFFQIQTLQKLPQIGVLKAIGTSNRVVSQAVIIQIVLVNAIGVLVGASIALGLGALLPDEVPAIFNLKTIGIEMLILLAIGPLGGLISVRSASKVEPLVALGLTN